MLAEAFPDWPWGPQRAHVTPRVLAHAGPWVDHVTSPVALSAGHSGEQRSPARCCPSGACPALAPPLGTASSAIGRGGHLRWSCRGRSQAGAGPIAGAGPEQSLAGGRESFREGSRGPSKCRHCTAPRGTGSLGEFEGLGDALMGTYGVSPGIGWGSWGFLKCSWGTPGQGRELRGT